MRFFCPMSRAPRTEANHLATATVICEELHNRVWFKKVPVLKVKQGTRYYEFHYWVYRMGMGVIKKCAQPRELVDVLIAQLPPERRDAFSQR